MTTPTSPKSPGSIRIFRQLQHAFRRGLAGAWTALRRLFEGRRRERSMCCGVAATLIWDEAGVTRVLWRADPAGAAEAAIIAHERVAAADFSWRGHRARLAQWGRCLRQFHIRQVWLFAPVRAADAIPLESVTGAGVDAAAFGELPNWMTEAMAGLERIDRPESVKPLMELVRDLAVESEGWAKGDAVAVIRASGMVHLMAAIGRNAFVRSSPDGRALNTTATGELSLPWLVQTEQLLRMRGGGPLRRLLLLADQSDGGELIIPPGTHYRSVDRGDWMGLANPDGLEDLETFLHREIFRRYRSGRSGMGHAILDTAGRRRLEARGLRVAVALLTASLGMVLLPACLSRQDAYREPPPKITGASKEYHKWRNHWIHAAASGKYDQRGSAMVAHVAYSIPPGVKVKFLQVQPDDGKPDTYVINVDAIVDDIEYEQVAYDWFSFLTQMGRFPLLEVLEFDLTPEQREFKFRAWDRP